MPPVTINSIGGLAGGDVLRPYLEGSGYFNVKTDGGAGGNGIVDDTEAIQSALDSGKSLIVPPGAYAVNNLVITKAGQTIIAHGPLAGGLAGGGPPRFLKNANGPMFTIANGASWVDFRHVYLDGNGGLFTGVGIDVQFQEFRFIGGRILNMDSYCVDFTVSDATARCTIGDCQLSRTDSSPGRPMIRLAPADTTSTDKILSRIFAAGDLVDTRGTETVLITGCDFQNMIFQNGSKKVTMVGNRMATLGADTTVLGVNHTILGNTHAGRFVIPSNFCTSCLVGPNQTVTASVDQSAPSSNNLLLDTYAMNFLRLGTVPVIFTTNPGTPESVVTAPPGSYCADTTNGEGYIKKTGTGNTGWKLVTHA